MNILVVEIQQLVLAVIDICGATSLRHKYQLCVPNAILAFFFKISKQKQISKKAVQSTAFFYTAFAITVR